LTALSTGWLHGCAETARTVAEATPIPVSGLRPVVLLGEVHDNAAQHAQRLDMFKEMLAGGARPALLMEQFDRDRQAAIDALRAQPGSHDADSLIAAAGGPGTSWNWAFYRPFIELALAHDLPIVAVNVSRADTRGVIAQGLAAAGFDAAVPAEIEAAQARAIEHSHCGMVDALQARRMAAAQIARDQFMARAVEAHAGRGVLLLAGNGHVRTDIGVPHWLGAATRESTLAIGLLEEGDDSRAAYDRVLNTPRQPRQDPCAALRAKPPQRLSSNAQSMPQT
jgi:uncharacterized iron-regulated protein